MRFCYIKADGKKEFFEIEKQTISNDKWHYIETKNKKEFLTTFLAKYTHGEKLVLFDPNHKQLLQYYKNNDIDSMLEGIEEDARMLFFTSGSSGFPTGALKTVQNLQSEIKSLQKLIGEGIKKVVVTVPFVHIYGVLAGILLPLSLGDILLVIKEDFLPYELVEEIKEEKTLVITTPVFIKALAKLPLEENLSNSLFISSTAPLEVQTIGEFESKYQTTLIQLFGSTETGGIAYKKGTQIRWIPLDGVSVDSAEERLSVKSPFISKYLLNPKLTELKQPYITEDIIKLDENGFILLGRSNKLIKIAGKRISALQIENALKEIPQIREAVVELVYKKEKLRSEEILITLEASKKIDRSVIKEKIAQCYGIITIPFTLRYVDSINYSAMGKKIIFNTQKDL